MTDRKSPSGPVTSIKGTIAIAATAIAATAAATATGSFVPTSGPNVQVGNVLSLSPQANLTGAVSVAFARVVTTGIVVVGFANVGASTSQAAVTFDADAATR
jgi:hypothetical protein